ncbi:SIR2 family protein [Affinibrenneria salicis]|uniref:SIR2 family protein n=1 Tax=Affinibrenneria salicis TaxID=2590031 RepID=A0A5J5FWM4_9GAMM|nr:SIR2 family protein [Affinibrenneria salicis]KAA8998219.1 SIR2 family protein [Affinibrenneria salicis]
MSIITNDNVHYNAIRKALANGNAAVMVGAGFSRNAENGDQLAMWYDIAKRLWHELNPQEGELTNFSASMVTQLGEQYARVFSKPALEEVLKHLIPDDRVRPGILHNQLLQLPWSEIFTTNYDTLLERAADDIVERAHYTVTCREDIPQSKILGRRRIVKLHGSFPSQRPFIFTEDDYRRYPELFAPFVNLVRQSLLENVFCLVGFSGDDPNFLHWIGWVRDMLDMHALPIYLFVNRAPSLGQRTLLEARKVTPVVLPQPDGIDESDYFSRFSAMFHILEEPLDEKDSDWGNIPHLDKISQMPHKNIEERLKRLLNVYSVVRKMHKKYPEWLIAPSSVRQRFKRSIDSLPDFLNGTDLREKLLKDTPHIGIVIFAEYAWHQEVLLQCFEDSLALSALDLLKKTSTHSSTLFNNQITDLRIFDIKSTIDFQQRWRYLGLSLLRWARQELCRENFDLLSNILKTELPKDFQLQDEIIYESILFKLYEGDRDIAYHLLSEWNIRSSDSYMFVRKGMLLGEVGRPEEGSSVSLKGLQQLRSNQRLHPHSTKYLSQEAWACLAINYLQTSQKWFSTKDDANDELQSEKLDRRLVDLAAKGFDSQNELQKLTAALNAETPPPSHPKSYHPQFDLGRYSVTEQLAGPLELREKIYSSFAWLTLSDRVALVPRIKNATFDIASFAQAAWWVQYADSMQRVLSVMIRSLNKNMLKPRLSNQLLHKAGWLSRYQVARTDESLAVQICTRSLNLIERIISNSFVEQSPQDVIDFHMNIFSRLVIRISNTEKVYSFMERVISLYYQPIIYNSPLIWKELAQVLSRCFETLPAKDRIKTIPLISKIPDKPTVSSHFERDWTCIHMLNRRPGDLLNNNENNDISKFIDQLIAKLQVSKIANTSELENVWGKLFWLNGWGFIVDNQKEAIKKILTIKKTWTLIPGHHPWATFNWLNDSSIDFDNLFRKWILSQELKNFSVEPTDLLEKPPKSKKYWSIDNKDELLENWIYSIKRKQWPKTDMNAGLKLVKKWWDIEWQYIFKDYKNIDNLHIAINQRLELIDNIVAMMVENKSMPDQFNNSSIGKWLELVITQGAELGVKFSRYRLSIALEKKDKLELSRLESELVENLIDLDIPSVSNASNIISYWVFHSNLNKENRPKLIIDAISGIISTRRIPVLPWALNLMILIVKNHSEWLTKSHFSLIDLGLKKMLTELSYKDRPVGSGIPDDNVPTLRWNCARLAKEIATNNQQYTTKNITNWLDLAPSDPLPELRFLKE